MQLQLRDVLDETKARRTPRPGAYSGQLVTRPGFGLAQLQHALPAHLLGGMACSVAASQPP